MFGTLVLFILSGGGSSSGSKGDGGCRQRRMSLMYIHVHAYSYDNSIKRLREYKTNLLHRNCLWGETQRNGRVVIGEERFSIGRIKAVW